MILHNVHAQARVLTCGGGGVWNSDSAGLQEGPGKIMELEKSQLNWVYCYLDSGLICFPLSRSHLKHFQRCRVKTAKRFRSRFASLRPEWSWWRRPRRCATRRSRWPLAANQCNITVIILIITIITIKVEVTTLQSSATSPSSSSTSPSLVQDVRGYKYDHNMDKISSFLSSLWLHIAFISQNQNYRDMCRFELLLGDNGNNA